jgi:SAM-dependent methyltransferase
VVGSGDGSANYGDLLGVDNAVILETDVSLAGSAKIVCDGSDLPFEDGSFDLIVCVAVLEHVLEFHRVLRSDGIVYASTPFMQQVHMGEYDFTRFTRSGHRWLFRDFDEISSGMSNGPASALVWSLEYFLMSWSASVAWRRIAKALTRILFGWLNWLDHLLVRREPALDGAGGFYFIGRRAEQVTLQARDMLGYYRGADDCK